MSLLLITPDASCLLFSGVAAESRSAASSLLYENKLLKQPSLSLHIWGWLFLFGHSTSQFTLLHLIFSQITSQVCQYYSEFWFCPPVHVDSWAYWRIYWIILDPRLSPAKSHLIPIMRITSSTGNYSSKYNFQDYIHSIGVSNRVVFFLPLNWNCILLWEGNDLVAQTKWYWNEKWLLAEEGSQS